MGWRRVAVRIRWDYSSKALGRALGTLWVASGFWPSVVIRVIIVSLSHDNGLEIRLGRGQSGAHWDDKIRQQSGITAQHAAGNTLGYLPSCSPFLWWPSSCFLPPPLSHVTQSGEERELPIRILRPPPDSGDWSLLRGNVTWLKLGQRVSPRFFNWSREGSLCFLSSWAARRRET